MNKKLKSTFLAAFLLFSIITITTPAVSYAATSPIGLVNYQFLIKQHPDVAQAQAAYDAAVKQAQDEFSTKSANMNDQEKQAYSQQLQRALNQKQQELLGTIRTKVNDAIKAVADAKGISIIIDKSTAIYGGQDITDEVLKKITGK